MINKLLSNDVKRRRVMHDIFIVSLYSASRLSDTETFTARFEYWRKLSLVSINGISLKSFAAVRYALLDRRLSDATNKIAINSIENFISNNIN